MLKDAYDSDEFSSEERNDKTLNILFPRTNLTKKAKATTSLWQMLCHLDFGTKRERVSLKAEDLRQLTITIKKSEGVYIVYSFG